MTRSTRGLARGAGAAVLALLLTVTAAPAAVADAAAETDTLLFATSLDAFTSTRLHPAGWSQDLDWGSDGCSFIGDRGVFDFLRACRRHDFGYRNHKKQHRFTQGARKRVDDQFRADMNTICGRYRGLQSYKGVACRAEARTFYEVVRAVGRVYSVRVGSVHGRLIRLYASADDPVALGHISNGSRGDSVWLDRSRDGGATWRQQAVSEILFSLHSTVTPPVLTSGHTLRVCGKAADRPEIACTPWAGF
ncbi:phospholipase [Herbidospora mongoliensis]|uniref:phospholipase n=1 Tax=Herbidospora mongoliensis TaxID=688067 RepID=UPI00082ECF5D|nr:phospholipase [Herbidospora mongoliensis]